MTTAPRASLRGTCASRPSSASRSVLRRFNRRRGSTRTPAGTPSMHARECCFRLTRAACRAHQEWARTVPRAHLWAFRPEYEAEAYERYGLRPAPPSAHPESQNDAMPSESG